MSDTVKIEFDDNNLARTLFGEHNAHLAIVEKDTHTSISTRGNSVTITGMPDDVEVAQDVLTQLFDLIKKGYPIYAQDIDFALRIIKSNKLSAKKRIRQ